jgi:hypothetical protein
LLKVLIGEDGCLDAACEGCNALSFINAARAAAPVLAVFKLAAVWEAGAALTKPLVLSMLCWLAPAAAAAPPARIRPELLSLGPSAYACMLLQRLQGTLPLWLAWAAWLTLVTTPSMPKVIPVLVSLAELGTLKFYAFAAVGDLFQACT